MHVHRGAAICGGRARWTVAVEDAGRRRSGHQAAGAAEGSCGRRHVLPLTPARPSAPATARWILDAVVAQVAEGGDRAGGRGEPALGHPRGDGVGAWCRCRRRRRRSPTACRPSTAGTACPGTGHTGALGRTERHDLGPVELAAAVLRRHHDAVAVDLVLGIVTTRRAGTSAQVRHELDQPVDDRVRRRDVDRRMVGGETGGVALPPGAEHDLCTEGRMAVGVGRDRRVRQADCASTPET